MSLQEGNSSSCCPFSLRSRRYPFPGLPAGFGRMLLFACPGDRLVLGGGERGCGRAEAQPPERDSHSRPIGEKRTPHHHHSSGTTGVLIMFHTFEETLRMNPPPDHHLLHSPQAGSSRVLYDLLPVVSFRGWPAVAQGWLTANHFWDGKITEEEAISGFYLLPCCSPLGGRPDREWRLAFSRSEVPLFTFSCSFSVFFIDTLSPPCRRHFKAPVLLLPGPTQEVHPLPNGSSVPGGQSGAVSHPVAPSYGPQPIPSTHHPFLGLRPASRRLPVPP